jgi:hypothetical protein
VVPPELTTTPALAGVESLWDAYTRTRVILMDGIENGAWNFAHHTSSGA